MVVLKTAILSEAVTSSWILGVPGPVASRTASRSMMVRAGTSRTVSHSGLTYMVQAWADAGDADTAVQLLALASSTPTLAWELVTGTLPWAG